MTFGYGLLGLIVAIAAYLIYVYNSLVNNKNFVAEGWSGIDVQLRRRADLIPNLIETVKGYASHVTGCSVTSPNFEPRASLAELWVSSPQLARP